MMLIIFCSSCVHCLVESDSASYFVFFCERGRIFLFLFLKVFVFLLGFFGGWRGDREGGGHFERTHIII